VPAAKVTSVRGARDCGQNAAWLCHGLAIPAISTTKDTMKPIRSLLLLAGASLTLHSFAADLRPAGVFVQAGEGEHAVHAATIGLTWPWSWQRAMGSGQWTGYTEAYLSRWSARDTTGRRDFDQVGIVPLFRYRGARGNSPWFFEGGIGLSYMDRLFVTPDKQFSTRVNFADVLGIGRSFGEQRQHEVTFRLSHFSNGGVKHPNPGQNLVRLKYAYLF
jgi:lipid A 3-O-deacylase